MAESRFFWVLIAAVGAEHIRLLDGGLFAASFLNATSERRKGHGAVRRLSATWPAFSSFAALWSEAAEIQSSLKEADMASPSRANLVLVVPAKSERAWVLEAPGRD